MSGEQNERYGTGQGYTNEGVQPNVAPTQPITNNPITNPGTGSTVNAGAPTGWDAAAYLRLNPDVAKSPTWSKDPLGHYLKYGKNENRKWVEAPVTPTKPVTPAKPINPDTAPVVPATAGPGQQNVVNYSAELVKNPAVGMTQDDPATKNVNESTELSDRVPNINENAAGTNINGDDPTYAKATGGNQTATQMTAATAGNAATATAAQTALTKPQEAQGYDPALVSDQIKKDGQMTAAQGTVSQNAIIDANEVPQADMQALGTGVNADGSVNQTGQALQQYASQDITNIIDTSTPAGKALAAQLGEGNYTDSKATLQGQLQMLQSQFVDPATGEPKIPAWAAATARNVQKIAAFTGVTGTAGIAAMSQALLEASLPIAQQDAAFFQTVTLKNLDNKQQATINRANVLAKFDQMNLDNRMLAAVENSKAFLAMDLKNLDNKQQANVLNMQARVQGILEDGKAVNASRLFLAQSENDMAMFYDQLNAGIKMANTAQVNSMRIANMQEINDMKQFNVSEINDARALNMSEVNAMKKFNATLENQRQEFYKTMQYNIDVANAKWRQDVTMKEAEMSFDAAATDVKNLNNISQEALNRIWDRSDALLDYAFKASEGKANRDALMAVEQVKLKAGDNAGWGSILGTIIGEATSGIMDWAF